MDLIFLDMPTSSSLRPTARIQDYEGFSLPGVQRITSIYAAEEARRNLSQPKQREDLEELLDSVEITATDASKGRPLFSTIELPDKDQPLVLAAIGAGATHLLIGDVQHFGPQYGERIEGVLILSPGDHLASRTG